MDEIGMTTVEAERLSLIRYQMMSAGEMVSAPPPINTLAINALQDVVESTLAAVGDRIRAEVKARSDFDKFFDAVVVKLGAPAELVGLRASAIALNNARVGFKHHGNQVRDETLRRHRDVADTLVHELVKAGFGIELEAVSMLIFIAHDGVRGFVERAEALQKQNELTRAMSYLRVAFDLAVDDYANRKSVDGWRTIFQAEPSRLSHISGIHRMGWEDPVRELTDWVRALDQRMRLAAMGVDLSRYAYFDAVTPEATYYASSEHGPRMRVRVEHVTDDQYRASYHFVVDTTVRLAAQDFNLAQRRGWSRPVQAYDPEFESEEYLRQQEDNARIYAEWEARRAAEQTDL